jgi:hypothetical protein
MDNTKVGSEGKKQSQPDDVARDGIDALFAGKDHIYSHSTATKLEGAVANFVPGTVKASIHEKDAKPLNND